MTHLWLRAEQRANEQRVALTPKGAQHLKNMGMNITVEASEKRCFSVDDYARAGCQIVDHASWPGAPRDAFILGLKELPQSKEGRFIQWFGKNVCKLLLCADVFDADVSIGIVGALHSTPEMVILDSNVLGPRCEFQGLSHGNCREIVLVDS